ncbi:MAG: hypothetical protein JW874_07005 [Spirochaetales bacterium]|nr:hypothetical protein [Spirochaetales bacterium]
MRTGFLQFNPRFADPEYNLELCKDWLMKAKADLVVLPELALSGYYFSSRADLESAALLIRDKCIPALSGLAALRGMAIVMGYPELDGDKMYNSALLILPDRTTRSYRKMHLFGNEKKIFDKAESGFPVFEYKGTKIGLLVCFDHYFPEAARSLALAGARIICHPANLVLERRAQLTTQVRAMENRVFWILANRTGEETGDGKTVRFTGASQIIGPDGDILLNAGRDDGGCGVIEIDPDEAARKQVTEVNDIFADRRVEHYTL